VAEVVDLPMDGENLEREAVKILFSAPAQPEEVVRADPEGPEIAYVCPFCGEAYQVSRELAGKTITCRNCREPGRVDAQKPKSKRTARRGMHPRSFWLGFALGVAVAALGVFWLKLARLL
jgi:hypothetical protein